MIILDATLSQVRRDRDFGRIEAVVTLLVKQSGQPVRPVSIRSNVLVRGAAPIRQRLVSDASALAQHRLPQISELPRVA